MRKIIGALSIVVLMGACKEKKEAVTEKEVELVETPIVNDWVSLTNATDWRGYNKEELPDNWSIKDGIIECFGKAGDVGGDVISTKTYDNFELVFEWKISKVGNSGVFYHVVEDTIYHSPYQTGPEYQVLDDDGYPDIDDSQYAGANYQMHIANDKKELKAVGEWNTSKIIFNNGHTEHWLNGEKIVEFNKYSDDWKERRNSGKWNDYPDYGKTNDGYLALQDHGAGVWYRNVKIKDL
ncbi:DUF1080 domain-containing protein [Cellulophaga sp. F20128]|uniref:3-keto-disaccharide hydrolase n=1 Tax=Cellulophaga sp. F20128 TaxID=2926413 RepID=UPI001FF1B508|nr:DUF1080 domain-containing protein [Cellulophaga sp. F20128]MCK0158333.1 DUF1080 domain-containing protein [Cellulophaga sp. F20128]